MISVLVINALFDTQATDICREHAAAAACVGLFSETWSLLLTHTCVYLTVLE